MCAVVSAHGGGVQVWQITSGAGGPPGGDRHRSVLMLLTLPMMPALK